MVFFWLWLYVTFYKETLTLSGTAAALAFFGLFLGTFVLGGGGGSGGSVVAMGNIGGGLIPLAQIALMAIAIGAMVYILLFLIGVLTTTRLPLSWLFLKRAQSAVARHYTSGSTEGSLKPNATPSAWIAIRRCLLFAILLCIPVLSFIVLLRFALIFNVGLMYRSAAREILLKQQSVQLRARQEPIILVLGILFLIQLVTPVLNLLLPAAFCTSICHLQHRGKLGLAAVRLD